MIQLYPFMAGECSRCSTGRLAMVCNTVEDSRWFNNTVEGLRWFCNTVEGLHSICKKIKSIAICKTWPNRQQTMLQCSTRLPSLTFLQTCELQAKKLTSSSKTLRFLQTSKELSFWNWIWEYSRPLTSKSPRRYHGDRQFPPIEDRKSTSYKVLRVLRYIAKSVPVRRLPMRSVPQMHMCSDLLLYVRMHKWTQDQNISQK